MLAPRSLRDRHARLGAKPGGGVRRRYSTSDSWCWRCSSGTAPTGRRIFRTTPEFAAQSAPLAANQGLYNGFLAAGLAWSLLATEPMAGALRLFFLACVAVAAVFGAATVGRRILWVQGLPAAVALLLDRLVRG